MRLNQDPYDENPKISAAPTRERTQNAFVRSILEHASLDWVPHTEDRGTGWLNW